MKTIQKMGPSAHSDGFTLTELTIVLVIVALLVGGLVLPLSAQREARNIGETKRQLAEIKEALMGFAVANGRLPCPAKSDDLHAEEKLQNLTTGECALWSGFLPAASLGITPVDAQGYAVDAWNNRIRYAITENAAPYSYVFTKNNGMRDSWDDVATKLKPGIQICPDATCAEFLTDKAVAVIMSTGANGNGEQGPDFAGNTNKKNFVDAEPSPAFDDIVTWISPYILYSRMIAAGKLP